MGILTTIRRKISNRFVNRVTQEKQQKNSQGETIDDFRQARIETIANQFKQEWVETVCENCRRAGL